MGRNFLMKESTTEFLALVELVEPANVMENVTVSTSFHHFFNGVRVVALVSEDTTTRFVDALALTAFQRLDLFRSWHIGSRRRESGS